ncbi:NAD(P)-dependent alcohol dehydrogenase [Nocardia cyriacigeorgica]|jgi:alcohol dehydrogenase (NADP+)|uniref:alcohol dehydrogenase (NADP(+)) n=2 Tax=Nocardia cyriacigeorgica TaxID=135487 RepID=A0A5R8PGQ2_9NOCA|nr:NAD(P)-dependent alcohol dehydrogenase [Nocardia cyriacigeorgica]MBF6099965.1 NAD(P)-dependent alcohol dehydrogenase [Nocardia cyriacigeorgica]MBF6159689.1 NAD(P)-dependent alcohol dehydrogenase [Nocardia cyriacigeorgica]MBF6198772.1 NAD(P)-dependent alcohol dehydrogenase [Nocardia cyriacigeorgica]MBF6316032.1 NAD(P)-dependent alcohol dehydrogenase [Nocardia cyriacigeorgica]MBF6342423.1 NAD(P)-dependent alcohol dehydrogenase [Nocardia cyriacigeorgica]
MSTATAYAMAGPDAPFEKVAIERRELGPHDVLIDIKYAGICHSDIHTARNEWGGANYPCVPGHEIAGIVAAVGSAVTRHKVGDRVGVGCMVDSCGVCRACLAGEEQYCTGGSTMTYNTPVPETVQPGGYTMGGYSTQVVVTENFVLSIPDGLDLDVAAPLLCAGITLFSPLRHWQAGPGKKVAIIGMGGLGHVGVKIAAALGAEVTVLSHSLSKQEDGKRFGAHHYYATSDKQTFRELRGTFDLIINTVSADLPIDSYMKLLALDGTLVILGLPEQPLAVRPMTLAGYRRSLSGSMIGGIAQTQEMLNFCAEHGIGAEIEVIAADELDGAYDRVVASDVRYRFVIDVATM